jgi:hypothetical protein
MSDASLREPYGANPIASGARSLHEQTATNDAAICARQTRQRNVPNPSVGNDLADRVGANTSQPELGTPPAVEPIGEWHVAEDGVPVRGAARKR